MAKQQLPQFQEVDAKVFVACNNEEGCPIVRVEFASPLFGQARKDGTKNGKKKARPKP